MKLKKLVNFIIIPIILSISYLVPIQQAFADDSICDNPNITDEIKAASGCPTSTGTAEVSSVIGNIIKAVVGILGIVAVVLIVIGGIQYMTSSGDSAKTKKAKDTILYALIGLAICALAFAITQWAIDAINGPTTTTP